MVIEEIFSFVVGASVSPVRQSVICVLAMSAVLVVVFICWVVCTAFAAELYAITVVDLFVSLVTGSVI